MVEEQKLNEDIQQEQHQQMVQEQELEVELEVEDHILKNVSYHQVKEEMDQEEDQTEEQEVTSEADSEKPAARGRAAAMEKIWSRKIGRKRIDEKTVKDDSSDRFENLEANQDEPTDIDQNWEIEEEVSSIKLLTKKLLGSVKAQEDWTKHHILTSLRGKGRYERKAIFCSKCSFKTISIKGSLHEAYEKQAWRGFSVNNLCVRLLQLYYISGRSPQKT